jgi:aspartyl/asparaginyl beta-hydroxylase (cupin superfamily)
MEKYFFDSDSWKYSKTLKNSFDDLRKEFEQANQNSFEDSDSSYSHVDIKSAGWKFLSFITKSKYHRSNIEQFPTVRRLIKEIPIYDNCLFSIIAPGVSVPSHTGFSDAHFRVHLGIKTDGQAWIRVGDQTQHWKEKEVLIFNDYANHEVCNPSDKIRVVFLFDIKREDYFNNVI